MSLPSPARWQRLSPLLDELLALDEAPRAARLAALAQDDPRLHAELQALLAHDEGARRDGFLAGSAGPDALVGQAIGPYTLLAPLGQGGSGTVWRARRDDGRTEQEVAIKLLHLSLVGHAAAERFRREGTILGRLVHPGIAGLIDAGVTPAGQPYLVLALVEGQPIDQHCERLGLDVEARVRLFLDVLDAVAHAHRHLVVHRDIKPANVLVDGGGRVRLLDFGIAKLLDADGVAGATALTRHGGRALTPEYAAPEQFGDGEVTTATDVYALGVLLYQLLAGRHPTLPRGGGAVQALRAALETEPERLSRAASGRLRRRLAGDLDNIVGRMLRKLPAERYPSVDAVATDLRRHLAHEPVSARPDGWAYRTGKFVRRHQGAVAAAALLALAVAGGTAGTWSQAERAREAAWIAQAERDRAREELGRAEAAYEFVNFLLSEGWTRPTSSLDLLDRAEHLVQVQFASDPALRARMLSRISDQFVDAGEPRRALGVAARAEQAASEAGDPATLATARCAQAAAAAAALDTARARRLYDDALAMMRQRADVEPSALVNCLVGRSYVDTVFDENPAGALAHAEEALQRLGTPRPGQRSLLLAAQQARANALDAAHRLGESSALYERILAELETLGRDRSIQAANALMRISDNLDRMGQTRRALDALLRAADIEHELRGADQASAVMLNNQAKLMQDVGDTEAAARTLARALAKAERDDDATTLAVIRLNDARNACEAGALARCRQQVARARAVLDPLLPPDHPRRAGLALVDAFVARAADDAATEYRALVEARRLQASGSGVQPDTLSRLSRAALRTGRTEEAVRHADEALQRARAAASGHPHSRSMGMALAARAAADAAAGRHAEAWQAWQEAVAHLSASVGPDAPPTREAARALASLNGPPPGPPRRPRTAGGRGRGRAGLRPARPPAAPPHGRRARAPRPGTGSPAPGRPAPPTPPGPRRASRAGSPACR